MTTLSLHHFEDDEMLGGYVHNEWVPSVRVDPENRCQLIGGLTPVQTWINALGFTFKLSLCSRLGALPCLPMGARLLSCPFGGRPMPLQRILTGKMCRI